jgi:hypothetical protein
MALQNLPKFFFGLKKNHLATLPCMRVRLNLPEYFLWKKPEDPLIGIV